MIQAVSRALNISILLGFFCIVFLVERLLLNISKSLYMTDTCTSVKVVAASCFKAGPVGVVQRLCSTCFGTEAAT